MERLCSNHANNMFDGWKAENKFEPLFPHIIPFVPFLKDKEVSSSLNSQNPVQNRHSAIIIHEGVFAKLLQEGSFSWDK